VAERLPEAVTFRHADLDIGDADAVGAVDWSRFDTIINAAAYTAVDAAESVEGRAAAWRVNATGVAHLVRAANRHRATLVHLSSEYVFDGRAPGEVTEQAAFSPLGAYGAAKAAGDVAASLAKRHYVVRTTWVVGNGRNFVRTMLALATRGVAPTVVADQIGRPTFADDLADAIIHLVATDAPHGTYHVTNTGEPVSWADVASRTFALAGRSPSTVTGTTTAAYFADKPHAAARPLNSVLSVEKAHAAGVRMPMWPDSLATYVKRENTPL
jgi:dTDP-4-dehydrorhamnose 3,5-epimerase